MIRLLHIAVSLAGEGIASYIYNYFTHMNLSEFEVDVIINNSEVNNIYQDPLEKLGITIYKVHSYETSTKEWLKDIDMIMKKKQYDILECHVGVRSNLLCKIGNLNDIPIRIIHTHVAYEPESIIKKLMRKTVNLAYAKYVTDYFGCSDDALKWTFGNLVVKVRSTVIRNAIDTDKFKYDETKRNEYRNRFQLNEDFIVGCVGRLCFQKNQEFLVDIFNEILKRKSNAKLILIGDGPNREMLQEKTTKLGIEKKVKFLGVRDDVSECLNAFDAFVLPSRYEGFGIVYLEAQVNKLQCFGTTERVPHSVCISDTMHFLSENETAEGWAHEILNHSMKIHERSNINISAFDINRQSLILEEVYKKLFDSRTY